MAYLAAYTCDSRLTPMIFCHPSVGVSMPPSMAMPALETNRSMRPKRSTVAATRFLTSSSRPTSAATGSAPIGAACRRQASWSRSDNTTWAPSFANRVHRASPIPLAPPVTTATLPLTSIAGPFQRRRHCARPDSRARLPCRARGHHGCTPGVTHFSTCPGVRSRGLTGAKEPGAAQRWGDGAGCARRRSADEELWPWT
jgi:hypothetical protein